MPGGGADAQLARGRKLPRVRSRTTDRLEGTTRPRLGAAAVSRCERARPSGAGRAARVIGERRPGRDTCWAAQDEAGGPSYEGPPCWEELLGRRRYEAS